MNIGIFHKGSGLGNQLHRYVATRILAMKNERQFGMIAPELFKGSSFIKLDMGSLATPVKYTIEEPAGKVVAKINMPLWEEGMYDFNPNFWTIPDNTIIDGEFQSELYFDQYLSQIRDWLQTEPMEMEDNLCIINFRGGEYVGVPDLFLPMEYWKEAIRLMGEKYPGIKFKCVTDDMVTAKKFFKMMPMSHELGNDWRSIRYAKHLILSNSSFAILPTLMNEDVKEVIAPEYWGGWNIKQWRWPMNKYKKFTYI